MFIQNNAQNINLKYFIKKTEIYLNFKFENN
jgi:hypothetical protein